jgi:hypothetical protein
MSGDNSANYTSSTEVKKMGTNIIDMGEAKRSPGPFTIYNQTLIADAVK